MDNPEKPNPNKPLQPDEDDDKTILVIGELSLTSKKTPEACGKIISSFLRDKNIRSYLEYLKLKNILNPMTYIS